MIKQEIAEIEDEFGVKLSEAVIMSDFNKYYPNDKKMFIKKYSNRLYENIKLSVEEDVVNDELKELSKKYGIKMVATNDAHYLNPDDAFMHEALLCNQRSTTLTDKNHWVFPGTGYHVHTTDEMERLFHDEPELLINTLEIADKCKFDFTFGEYKLPKFPIPEGYTDKEYLRKLVLDGFKERFQGTPELTNQEYLDRVEFELETIFKMGYQGYFFIVWDYIRWAKEQGIYVGPGRGSGAGSIVLYCLHITENLDPLKFDLLFERFLNPDRISMPDIDVDFEYELREKVIEYCKMKYGNECVSKIITFGRMAAKSAILDMTRVLDYPLATARKISDMIPKKPGITLKKAMLENVELDALYHNDEEAKTIIDLALKVEGLVRNTSVHACGVIIAPDDVTKFCPQAYAVDDETGLKELTTQYTMGECEEIGLLKMDFLGLRTESVIKECVTDVEKYHGITINPYDINSLPLNDPMVYANMAKGNTMGIFQIEGAGITSVIQQLFQDVEAKVNEINSCALTSIEEKTRQAEEFGNQLFERLIAGISLYRPGPMDEIPNYINGMLDENNIHYDCAQLEPILKNTYGVLVYQEQVMLAVRALADFSAGQSDTIRKAMGKKKQDILDEYKDSFIHGSGDKIDAHTNLPYNIKGCVANGILETVADTIWGKMESFAKYAFNKSHAAAYAVISIQTAWFAYYYPTIFMKANLNVYITNPDKLTLYLGHCNKVGIPVLPPSVNESDAKFTLNDDATAIIFGLSGIKNVGKTAPLIIEERRTRGKFLTLQNFVERMVKYHKFNKSHLESLALAGALDCFPGSRKSKVEFAEEFINIIKSDKAIVYKGQETIFSLADSVGLADDLAVLKDIKIPNSDIEYSKDMILDFEEEVAGFYLSGHPLDDYVDILKTQNYLDVYTATELKPTGKDIKIAGIVTGLDKKYGKNGKPFYIFKLKDRTGDISVVAWSNVIDQYGTKLTEKAKVILSGEIDENDFGVQMKVNHVVCLDEVRQDIKWLEVLACDNTEVARTQYQKVALLVQKNPGDLPVRFKRYGQVYDLGMCTWSMDLLLKLQDIFTEDFVKYHTGLKHC